MTTINLAAELIPNSNEPFLFIGMIDEDPAMWVVEDGLGFFKPDAVFTPVTSIVFFSSHSNRSILVLSR
jgi:hypothetical protein